MKEFRIILVSPLEMFVVSTFKDNRYLSYGVITGVILLGRKVMTNLDSIFKSRDIANKGPSSQGYGFSSGHV